MNSEIGLNQCPDRVEAIDCPSNLLKIKRKLASLRDQTSKYKRVMAELHNEIRFTEALLEKYIAKVAKKTQTKGPKKNSGFAAPVAISDALCDFVGLERGSLFSRTEATKYINKYIKDNSLVDAGNKTLIKPDAKLHSLLGTDDNDVIKYFNLQKYLNVHFVK